MFTPDHTKAYFKEEELSDRRLRIIEIEADTSPILGKRNYRDDGGKTKYIFSTK